MIEFYIKENCPLCEEAKRLLDDFNIIYDIKILGKDFMTTKYKQILLPYVIIDNNIMYFGLNEIRNVLTEQKDNFGKMLLTE